MYPSMLVLCFLDRPKSISRIGFEDAAAADEEEDDEEEEDDDKSPPSSHPPRSNSNNIFSGLISL
jgi:hypothetical protein